MYLTKKNLKKMQYKHLHIEPNYMISDSNFHIGEKG